MAYKHVQPPCPRKSIPTTSKGKSRQVVVTDNNSASNEVESEDEDEDEVTEPPPKCLKTTSSISASVPRRSAKRIPASKCITKAAAKPVPASPLANSFRPVLLADTQGHLRLPDQSSGPFNMPGSNQSNWENPEDENVYSMQVLEHKPQEELNK
ncbi:hypothetical protein EV359DRAFT_67063 [Lentinula novae-zelandiae]|nr:hypothetical protein EV359DRAFT_67063 [Lentinula novae-zelandiae]